ncbi:uncharacterized protein LOC128286886 isoform X2 [Gossypium arboreum]|uniref:uncharacterized protein LOC128286886 isoform X2 n=1 Tax=Gossypium arboreum TaxID=29729 RepID=UPI0022F1674B|nr:uncharacterized protein LOC128286886 isoform X2 [Gossypium arboreum]
MAKHKLGMGITSCCRCFILALLWFQSQGCLEEERAALLQIKDSMNSSESSAFSNCSKICKSLNCQEIISEDSSQFMFSEN